MQIGVDVGGTKIEAVALNENTDVLCRLRVNTPKNNYSELLSAIEQLLNQLQQKTHFDDSTPIGLGTPGALNSQGLIKNSNSVCLNGKPFLHDLEKQLDRPVRISNDANCFALSEAIHGAAKDADSVFGVIIGTGTGGALVLNKKIINGANSIAGEWGHNLMPGLGDVFENEQRQCYCGRKNCIETYLCGEGFEKTFKRLSGLEKKPEEINTLAKNNDEFAQQTLHLYAKQFAYASAQVINIFDPNIVVLGGGLSNLDFLYEWIPHYWKEFVFSDEINTQLTKAQHGDSSGVFGAAWLWPANTPFL